MWSLGHVRPRCGPVSASSSRSHATKPFTTTRPGARMLAHGATQQPLTAADTSYKGLWDAFASKVQGEWEGVTVNFNAEGVAQPLPERYVPGAYREWGVELYDWQSQSSCLLTAPAPGAERGLRNIFKRLMPTVGCEADAIAFVEEADDVWKADGGSLVKPVTASGGYVAAPAELPARGGKVKVEVCLAAPPGGKSRLRAAVTLMQHWESKEWQVAFVDLSRETYDGPFNGGVELSGCAGGGKPFAKEPATSPQQLAGAWSAKEVHRYSCSDATGGLELQPTAVDQSVAASSVARLPDSAAMLLPLGVWVACAAAKSDVRIEVGALRGESERDVAVCTYAEGRIAEVVLASEAK